MAIVWDDRNNGSNPSTGNSQDCFQEHNQRMKAFRLAHPGNWRQWGRSVPEVQEGLQALVSTVLLPGVLLETYSPN